MKTKTGKRAVCAVLAVIIAVLSVPIYSVVSAAQGTAQIANIVVFVKFSGDTDDLFNTPASGYTRAAWERLEAYYNDTSGIYNGIDCSFKSFISEISRGKLNVTNFFPQVSNGVVATHTLNNTLAHYDSNDELVIEEVIAHLTAIGFPSTGDKVDNSTQGVIDNLTIIIQGASDSDTNSLMWPHKSVSGSTTRVGGKYYVRNYNILNSESVFDGERQGVIAHEFLHSVGFPDLYHYSGGGYPVAFWDIMGSASQYPSYPLAYMRSLMGWVPVDTITQSGTYTLNVASGNTGTAALKIQTPMSSTEFFVLEYRERRTSSYAGLGFDTKVPSSGLLMYRVNNSLEHLTNSMSTSYATDYIYVFRPHDTTGTAVFDNLVDAAVNPAEGEASYGSADFTAPSTSDTIHYSSGKNSGITIENVAYSQDMSQITFDVTIPDYTSLDLWDKTGDVFATGVSGDTELCFGQDGTPYAAFTKYTDTGSEIEIFKWNGTAWGRLGAAITNAYTPKLLVFNGTPYVTYTKYSTGNAVIASFNGTAWSTLVTDTSLSYPDALSLITDGESIYMTCAVNNYSGSSNLLIKKLSGTSLSVFDDSFYSSNTFSNARFEFFGGKIYALFSYFGWNLSDPNAMIYEYNPATGIWTLAVSLNITGTNLHSICSSDGKLAAVAGKSGSAPVIAEYDGVSWTQQAAQTGAIQGTGLNIALHGNNPFISCVISDEIVVFSEEQGEWTRFGSAVTENSSSVDLGIYANRVFVLASDNTTGNTILFMRDIPVDEAPLPQLRATEGSKAIVDSENKFILGLGEGLYDLSFFVYVTEGGSMSFDGLLSTGRTVKVLDSSGAEVDSYTVVIAGDMNGDSRCNGMDAFVLRLLQSSMLTRADFSAAQLKAADKNGDGAVDTLDVEAMIRAK